MLNNLSLKYNYRQEGNPNETLVLNQQRQLNNLMMIEIFKTNVQNKTQAKRIINLLKEMFSEAKINFDLGDRDKILRVEGIHQSYLQCIVDDLNNLGFTCEILH